MARPRLELQALLEALVEMPEPEDKVWVYFQPPGALQYPCIKYDRGLASDVSFADDIKYVFKKAYTITVIVRDPDSLIPDLVEGLKHCRFDRKFVVDGLHHFVYQLFF